MIGRSRPARAGFTVIEMLVGAALMSLIVALCCLLLPLVLRGATPGDSGGGRMQRLSIVLEAVLRELRTSRKVVLPPLYPTDIGGPPETAGFCYFVNAEMECVLLHVQGGRLYRTVLGADGGRRTGRIAEGLGRVAFSPIPGAHPQMRVAMTGDGAVLIGRAPLLNTETPMWTGGDARVD